jgi:pyruvate dehydrogenase E2 component (dihydrolipoamide acetyltransferase)
VTLTKVVLAKLSPTMEEGTIVKWNKKEGDPVKQGDVLAEIETDKANMEMEAMGSGVLRKILVPAGGKSPVGALIGVIADPNEDISKLLAQAGGGAAKPAAATPEAAPAASPAAAPGASTAAATGPSEAAAAQAAAPRPAPPAPAPSPASAGAEASAKAAPADQPASVASAARTPPAPASAPRPVSPSPPQAEGGGATAEGGRVKASPLARSMAAHRNIDLSSVAGSGPGGRIIKRDIESWAGPRAGGAAAGASSAAPGARPAPAPAPRPAPPVPSITPGQELPLSNMRKTIAKRLSESKFTAPHYYVTVEIDMAAAVDLREQLQRLEEAKVSFNDLVVKACATGLTRFPLVNASWAGDKIVTHAEVNIGIAVALPDGLITPVVRNADRKSVLEIAHEVRDLATRAREKKLKPEEFTGSTFTISNLGMYDVTQFTAIINPPDSAILAVGAVRKVPVVDGDDIQPGHRMNVTMSSDHRVIDGALSAQFLAEVRRLLETPVGLLL